MRRLLFISIALALVFMGACTEQKPWEQMTPVERGEALFGKFACYSCHRIGLAGALKGPTLTHVGDRLSPEDIRVRIKNPKAFNPRSQMPQIPMTGEELDYLVAYLSTLKEE